MEILGVMIKYAPVFAALYLIWLGSVMKTEGDGFLGAAWFKFVPIMTGILLLAPIFIRYAAQAGL